MRKIKRRLLGGGILMLILSLSNVETYGQQVRERQIMKKQHNKAFSWGKKRRRLPSHAKQIEVGDSTVYWYKAGTFYEPWWGKYKVVPPPIGVNLSARPAGYLPMTLHGEGYYYFNGMFLQKNGRAYEIVPPPEDAQVYFLPKGERIKLVIDDRAFFWLNGTYYEKIRSETGYPAFKIIGSALPSSVVTSP